MEDPTQKNDTQNNPVVRIAEAPRLYQPIVFSAQQPNQVSVSQYEEKAEQPTTKWSRIFRISGIIQLVVISIYCLIFLLISLIQRIYPNISDFDTLGLGLVFSYILLPIFTIATAVNIIGLPIYIFRYRPTGRQLKFNLIILAVSCFIAMGFIFSTFYSYSKTNDFTAKLEESTNKELNETSKQFEDEAAKSEVSKNTAIKLLEDCEIVYFYGRTTNNSSSSSDLKVNARLNAAEHSTSGVIIIKDLYETSMYASKKMTLELRDKVFQLKQTCTEQMDPYVIVDGVVIE